MFEGFGLGFTDSKRKGPMASFEGICEHRLIVD